MNTAQAASGEFEELVSPHLGYLYGLAHRVCGESGAAEDVVQDALLRAFRRLGQLRDRSRARAWLSRIVVTACTDHFRKEGARDEVSLDDDRGFSLFDTLVEEDPFPYSDRLHLDFLDLFDDAKVVEVLRKVHPAHRTALVLAYVYGYKAREIADITRTTVGTVLARLHRGRKQLERALWDYANERGLLEREKP